MQYHENGFHPGDPDILPTDAGEHRNFTELPEQVDVLIVGCGPAGLTLAAYLSGFPDITTCIIDSKSGPMEKGQADGVSCRSMEMFQAFGFAEKVKREAYWVNEASFWNPDPEQPTNIVRTGRVQDVEDGLSEMPHVILNQARVHDHYLHVMRNSVTRLEPTYGCRAVSVEVDGGTDDHPVRVVMEQENGADKSAERIVKARYVVGCDGARSSIRRAIGRKLKGDRSKGTSGVMDVLAVTDFPDWRIKSLIKSSDNGNIILIPREGGHLVRVYVELDVLAEAGKISLEDVTLEGLITSANQILSPYRLDVKETVWWSVYQVGHSLTDKFDNVAAEDMDTQQPRVFIAGDACHTHSARAGQGMNVSMGDTFNLAWKLVAVLQHRSPPTLLHSYSAERQKVAQDLIDFDHEWARIVGKKVEADSEGQASPDFQNYFVEHGRYTAGVSVTYAPSILTGPGTHQHLAPGFDIGMRFHSAPVLRLADAKPLHLGQVVKADSAWRLIAFAPADRLQAIEDLCRYLEADPASPLNRFTPQGQDIDTVIDTIAVFQQGHRQLELNDLPRLLRPAVGRYGLTDYEKAYCANPKAGDIFDMRGVNRQQGCMVIVRPDQYVAHVLPLDAYKELSDFFSGFMLPVK